MINEPNIVNNSMKVLYKLLEVILFLFGVISCSKESKYVEYGQVSFIDKFPKEITLKEQKPYMSNLIGTLDIVGLDSVIVLLNWESPYLSAYSANSGNPLGRFVKQGQGPGEVSDLPANLSLTRKENDIILRFSDSNELKYFNLNLTRSLEADREVYDTIKTNNLFRDAKDIIPLSVTDTIVYHHTFNGEGELCGNIPIKLVRNGVENMITNLRYREGGFDGIGFNTVTFVTAYNPRCGIVAEAMTKMNQINLYSVKDTTFRKTVCVGKELDDAAEEYAKNLKDWKVCYQQVQPVGDGFAALRLENVTSEIFDEENFEASLQFFSCTGDPLLEIKIPFTVNSFFIDGSGILYLFTRMGDSESIYRYEVPEIKKLAS